MTNLEEKDFSQPKSERWKLSNFNVNNFSAELLESDLETAEIRQLMSEYAVNYDLDPHVFDDRIILDMICGVNADAELPGYRFVSLFMPEFRPLFSYEGVLSSQMITADDLEFFLKSAYLEIQDHFIVSTNRMLFGPYLLPPPDLDLNFNDLLHEG